MLAIATRRRLAPRSRRTVTTALGRRSLVESAADRDGAGVRSDQPSGVGSEVVGLFLRDPLGLNPSTVDVDLGSNVSGVPAEYVRDQFGDGRSRTHAAVRNLDGYPGASGQQIVEVQGALVGRA